MVNLRLYLCHRSSGKDRVVQRLERALEAAQCDYRLEIVDLLDQPDRGLQDLILVTPTLLRHQPPPERRVCGDLSDPRRVLVDLGLAKPR